jgi:hypothetical protein
MDWQRHYASRSHIDGRDTQDIRLMWPKFQQAAQLDDVAWQSVEKALDWWLDVWWFYLQGAYGRAAQNLQQAPTFNAETLVAMVQFYLIVSPLPATLTAVNQFWADAIRQGLVTQKEKQKVTMLYLTLFGQALLAKRAQVALAALMAALRYVYHPGTWQAWLLFLKAGLTYFGQKPWHTDKTLVNWKPK